MAKYEFPWTKVGSIVEWLKRRDCDRHSLDSKLTRAILLCPWERHFTALSPPSLSHQVVPNFTHSSIKLKNQNKKFLADSNIVTSPEAGWDNCLSYV